MKRGEAPDEAAVRELTEEIGMIRHGAIRQVDEACLGEALPVGDGALFLLTAVEYRPRRSLEIESVREFDPDSLPPDVSPFARRFILRAAANRVLP